MGNTTYFSGIVKILEKPTQSFDKNETLKTTVRVEIAQIRQNKILSLIIWGNLGNEIKDYYQVNDYILIEGYPFIKTKRLYENKIKFQTPSITVLKVYPFHLDSDQQRMKI